MEKRKAHGTRRPALRESELLEVLPNDTESPGSQLNEGPEKDLNTEVTVYTEASLLAA